jgi:NitT/TauT family transport system permease protein
VLTPDTSGEIPLLVDTLNSMRRFTAGVLIGSVLAVAFGIALGVYPAIETVFLKVTVFLSKIPLIAAVPIFFVLFGLGEGMKIFLIVLGIFFFISLDVYGRVKAIPREQFIKGIISGASNLEIVNHVVLRQVMPAALTSIRINLLSAWLFLISSEAFAADSGLGYRIFVVRRYLAMDIIIPYVLWIAILSFSIDALLAWWIKKKYPWYEK